MTAAPKREFVFWEFFPMFAIFVAGLIVFAAISNHDGKLNIAESLDLWLTLSSIAALGIESVWRSSRYD